MMILGKSGKEENHGVQTLVHSVLLFAAALLPRLLALDTFLTPDEYRWLGRSRGFLVGLLSGDWAATLQTGHPGVTTMWTGSLGILYRYWTRPSSAPDDLSTFVQQVPNQPLDASYVGPVRFPTVLLMSLFVVAFYLLLTRLFGDRRVGLVGALLLALNPFFIALSRVLHHDALAAAFMTLSLLPLIGYWLQDWSRRWLLLSGVAAGLSFLSKSPAMFLMPFCALLGLIWAVRRWRSGEWRGWSDVRQLLGDGLLWGAVAWLTAVLLWPAMWVTPIKVLEVLFGTSSQYATEGHGKGNFFLGQITRDPGPLFYPVAWLLRTTPLTLLGLLALGISYVRSAFSRRSEQGFPTGTLSGVLLLFAGLFVAFVTLGEKKQDRYVLPIYPILDALAALGMVQISGVYTELRRKNSKSFVFRPVLVIVLAILLAQGFLVIANYPYYFTYFNPLLGGARTAARVMTVGWGEGLDQAAAYLNELPDAERLRITSWYHYSFAPYFRGEATFYASDAGQTLGSDYAVVYRNQIQRQLPTTEIIRYLLQHHTPVFTTTMKGLDYVYVYQLPLNRRSQWETSRLPGRVTFFGVAGAESEPGGNTRSLRLYWQNEGLGPDDKWWVALQPVTSGPRQAWQACQLRSEFADERFVTNALLESDCRLTGDWPSVGVYHLRVGVGTDADQVTNVPFPEGELAVAVEDSDLPELVSRLTALEVLARDLTPEGAHPADLVYQGVVRLIGYRTRVVSTGGRPSLELELYWQALEPVPLAELNQVLGLGVSVLSQGGEVLAIAEEPFIEPETWPVVWPPGTVLTRTFSVSLPDPVPSQSQLKLDVRLSDQSLPALDSSGKAVEPIVPASDLQ
jgi:4-amino-4-deoxy-L-arabinose transferase-like glycosyltransferase